MVAMIMAMAGLSAQLVPRIGARPLLMAGSAIAPAACSGCRGSTSTAPTPAACSARCSSPRPAWACCSCRATLVALSKVEDRDAGLAASLLNTGQQVGGSIGLAILGTVAWTVVANTARSSAASAKAAAATAAKAGHPLHLTAAAGQGAQTGSTTTHWPIGFSRGFESRPGSC